MPLAIMSETDTEGDHVHELPDDFALRPYLDRFRVPVSLEFSHCGRVHATRRTARVLTKRDPILKGSGHSAARAPRGWAL